ncbi:unnamed protein product [Urochloa humidicola]
METPTELEALPDDALRRRKILPHYVHGIFLNYIDHCRPHLFSCRRFPGASSASRGIDGMLDFLPTDDGDWWSVLDHCRGLVLCDIKRGGQLCVCNPAMQTWTLVPPRWQVWARWRDYAGAYLAYDPAMSVHYEVVLIPIDPERPQPESPRPQKVRSEWPAFEVRLHGVDDAPFCLDDWLQFSSDLFDEEEELPSVDEDTELNHVDDQCQVEWPPTLWMLDVFSSRVGRWEERAFVRQGDPVATVQDMQLDQSKPTLRGPRQRYAAYWHGALYVHCRGSFIARFSLLNDTYYQVIKMPRDVKENTHAKPYVGISEKGVYFGIVHKCQLQIWILSESRGHMEWILKYEHDLTHYAHHVTQCVQEMDAPCIVHDLHDTDNVSEDMKESLECDSDSDDDTFTIKAGSTDEEYYGAGFDVLGFHPYKEIVFLADYFTVVACHLKTSKVQYLGNSRPKSYYRSFTNDIYESFVYTPCMIGELNNKGSTMKEN